MAQRWQHSRPIAWPIGNSAAADDTRMPLASALEPVLNHYDIYDIDDLVAILRSPDDASQVADLIDKSRALLDATAKTAHVSVQTEAATATVGTTMHSLVNVREKSSLATFSPATQARMVSSEVSDRAAASASEGHR